LIFLTSEEKQFVADHANSDPSQLMLSEKRFPKDRLHFLVQQIAGQQKARTKFSHLPYSELLYPPVENIAQSSSSATALFKTSLISGDRLVDLTGGFGIDSLYFSKVFKHVHYVEPQQYLHELVEYNSNILNVQNLSIHSDDAGNYLKKSGATDYFYIDPSRRKQGRRYFKIEDCEPNVIELLPSLIKKAKEGVLLKLSPMADITEIIRVLPSVSRVYVVDHQKETRELLVLFQPGFKDEPNVNYANLEFPDHNLSFLLSEEKRTETKYSEIKDYIFDPHSGIHKCGCYGILGDRFNLEKIHPNSHFFTGNQVEWSFPGRIFRVMNKLKYNHKAIGKGGQSFNVISRNFPDKPSQIIKKLKIKEGGEDFLVASTDLSNNKVLLRCERIK